MKVNLCRECRRKVSAYTAARRAARAARGLCITCKRPALPDRQRCERCAAKLRVTNRMNYEKRNQRGAEPR